MAPNEGNGEKMRYIALADNLVPTDPKKDLKQNFRFWKQGSAKTLIEQYAKESEARMAHSAERRKHMGIADASVRQNDVEERVSTLGSEEDIYSFADCGLFAAVLMAYNNHWNLRTSPEDWWFCVTRRVAIAIDKNSKKDSVRKMFVEHEGKKTLQVIVPPTVQSIYSVDYSWFFNEMAMKISENVKVPEYVDAVTADFSQTTEVQKIVSQITLMSSLQEFFEFRRVTLCGIPGMEMLGTEEDWKRLQSKLKVLRTLLEPIENDIGLPAEWWSLVEKVFQNLLETYQGRPDKNWWSHIMCYTEAFGSGRSGYTGWIIRFMEGTNQYMGLNDFSSGLVAVPLTIEDAVRGVEDTAALVAGMLGFTLHEGEPAGVTSVQPFQGWSLLLPENSPLVEIQ